MKTGFHTFLYTVEKDHPDEKLEEKFMQGNKMCIVTFLFTSEISPADVSFSTCQDYPLLCHQTGHHFIEEIHRTDKKLNGQR
jgi:hypothetical protein